MHEGIKSGSYLVLQHVDCLQRKTMPRKTERSSCLFVSLPKGLLTRKANLQEKTQKMGKRNKCNWAIKLESQEKNMFFPF